MSFSVPPSPRLAGLAPCTHGSVADAELRSLGLDPAAVIDFSASTNPCGPSPRAVAALAHVDFGRYPDDAATDLHAALARRTGVPPASLLAGNGSVELIWLLALAYLDPGDAVVVVGPTFGEYERAAKIAGADIVPWQADAARGFRPDAPAIAELVQRTRPRLTFLCNPNNPTGAYLGVAEIASIVAASRSGLVVLDEAYLDFVRAPVSTLDLVGGGRVVVLRSLTKDYALAGLRLGYAVAAPDVIAALRSVRPPWSVSAAAQAAALAAVEDEPHLVRSRLAVWAGKAWLEAELPRLGLTVVPSAANFLLVEVGDGRRFRADLLRHGCCVRDCASFGLPGYVRIGVRTRPECERLVAAMKLVLAGRHAG